MNKTGDNPMLPPEMLHTIFGFCNAPTVLNIHLVCHHFLLIIKSKSFWSDTLIVCPQTGTNVSAISHLHVALHTLHAEELHESQHNMTCHKIKQLINSRPLAEYDYNALIGAHTLQDSTS